jgi:hypothetical protein
VDPGRSPAHEAASREVLSRIQAGLDRLGALDRELLALRHFEGLRNDEAALVLGLSSSSAKRRHAQALRVDDVLTPLRTKGTTLPWRTLHPRREPAPTTDMKTTREIVELLRQARPGLEREFGIRRLALFGSYARGEQREDSDVDVLVDVAPTLGLRFVDLADRIEDLLGVRSDVVSRRAIQPQHWALIEKELVDVG